MINRDIEALRFDVPSNTASIEPNGGLMVLPFSDVNHDTFE